MEAEQYFKQRPLTDIEKDELNEREFFFNDNWDDDSCGNYVAFLRKFKKFNVIVSRVNAARAGLYCYTVVDPNIHSGSDPNGEHREWWENRLDNIDLRFVARLISIAEKYD